MTEGNRPAASRATGPARRRRVRVVLAVAAAAAIVAAAGVVVLRRRAPPPGERRSTTTLALRITDRGAPVAARVLLSDARGPLHMGNLDLYGQRQGGAACAIAPAVVGSWDGLIVGRGVADVPVGDDRCVPS